MRVFGLPAGFARLAKYSRNDTEELSEKALFKWQVLELSACSRQALYRWKAQFNPRRAGALFSSLNHLGVNFTGNRQKDVNFRISRPLLRISRTLHGRNFSSLIILLFAVQQLRRVPKRLYFIHIDIPYILGYTD